MSIVTSIGRTAVAGVLALAFAVPAAGEPDEELPDGPAAEAGEILPDGEEESAEAGEVDVLKTLEEAREWMKEAERSLARLPDWRATDERGQAIRDVEDLLKARQLQEKALRELTRLFDSSREGQGKAIDALEALIKAAKDEEGSGTSGGRRPERRDEAGRRENPNPGKDQARESYNSRGVLEGKVVDRMSNPGEKWGNLPDRLREELSQAAGEFEGARGAYRDKLLRYSKVLGERD
jgi:hypothetical protein